MKRVAVNSTSIASIGYDPKRRELEIEFHDTGDVYRYFGVLAGEHAGFMAAESKGTYLNQVFKRRGHHYFIVKEGKRLASNG
jgi:KTSC domain